MATHGTIGEFKNAQEDWRSYVERLQQYFVANDVQGAEKQRAVLLSAVGGPTYQLIRNLVAPEKPHEKTFAQIVDTVQRHHQPKPSVIVQRFNFHSRTRASGETVSTFVAELRKLSEHCNFGETLNDMLRDRLVCGINDQRLQRRLLSEPELPFAKALELAEASEAAERHTKELGKVAPSAEVHTVSSRDRDRTQKRGGGHRTISVTPCYRCGGKHPADKCRFRESECHHCGKMGHIAKVCRGKQRGTKPARMQFNTKTKPQQTHHVDASEEELSDTSCEPASMFNIPGKQLPPPLIVTMELNEAKLQMEVDTGASASIISYATYTKLWPKSHRPPLLPSTRKLRTYTSEELKVEGCITVDAVYGSQRETLSLLVVAGNGPSLLGRDWLLRIRLDWQSLHRLQAASPIHLRAVLDSHSAAFKDELGRMTNVKAKIFLNPEAQPRFCKPRSVPFALRAKVNSELERLEKAGVIEPVQFSDWAAPIVPVLKPDGSVRICGDYKVTVNRAAKTDSFPLPRIDDLFASLAGGQTFSKLDLAHAYQQIELDDESKKLVVINTQKGLFQYNRLPFGVSAAPAIFQRTIEGVLRGIPHVCVYLDDILITGDTEAEHLHNLDEVLTRLEEAGMRLKQKKCSFTLPAVEYLGHNISAEGLRPTNEKIRAITEAPVPQDITQLRAFLGLLNYYGKFLQNLSSLLAPLYKLLEKKSHWVWRKEQQDAFEEAKTQLTSSCLLMHFDPLKEVILSCDASPYGVGAVLSHRTEEGERPVAFASRSLSTAEKKYAHLDKEGLAIIFGVKKFHGYLFGRRFEIRSDHKPLQYLFDNTKAVPQLASARLQRWALILSAYNYTISYKPGAQHANADSLSRLPLPESPVKTSPPADIILLMDTLQASPVTAQHIRKWTDRDPLLSRVRTLVLHGWKNGEVEEMKPFNKRCRELSVEDGCLLWGTRVVVPERGRSRVLEQLHEGHPGVSRMKGIARSITWWPGIDKDIERQVQNCTQCQQNQKSPAPSPLHSWEWPDRPWSRLHVDHAGPFLGKYFLLVVDAHSKWLEVMLVPSTSTANTVQKLRIIFATHGLPEVLVSDNATCFTSTEFQEFLTRNGIRHITSAPYHPATNGLAERAVQTFKNALKKTSTDDLETRLSRFLFHYRTTPHSTTGLSPAELLLGRRPRSLLTLMQPTISSRVQNQQVRQKRAHDIHAKTRHFSVDDSVFIRNFGSSGQRWLPGVITEVRGPQSFCVELADGRIVRRHIDHVRNRTSDHSKPENTDIENASDDFLPEPTPPEPSSPNADNPPDMAEVTTLT